MIFEFIFIIFLIFIIDYLWRKDTNKKLKNFPGPFTIPIIGGVWMYFGVEPDELLEMSRTIASRYGRTFKTWIFHICGLYTSDMRYIQALLTHPTEIKKNRLYALLEKWLGEGLLMSYGSKWVSRRKAITPAFHFKILENFVEIFDQQAQIFANKCNKFAIEKYQNLNDIKENPKHIVDVEHFIALATLDVICETAMGVKINAQTDDECEYVKLIIEMQNIILERFVRVTYRSELMLKLFNPQLFKRYINVMGKLHKFTERVIQERRLEMLNQKSSEAKELRQHETEDVSVSSKKRMALLDILLSSSSAVDGQPLSDSDIREEVDTFMFEGHDTTKSGIGFTLYALARHPDIQEKVYAEICEVIGDNLGTPLSYNQLMDLKYLDKVIKESLRMYPPVPFIGRHIQEDIYIDNQCIPKGSSVLLALITMQNDPEYFKEPHKFIPERYDEHSNTFAFVPFSAGPRNCIGQRFAMLEMKAMLVRTLMSYELLPLGDTIELTVSIILKSKNGWQMGFRRRYEN